MVMVEESKHVTSIQQSQEASLWHIACYDKPDCITQQYTSKHDHENSPSPVKGEKRTKIRLDRQEYDLPNVIFPFNVPRVSVVNKQAERMK